VCPLTSTLVDAQDAFLILSDASQSAEKSTFWQISLVIYTWLRVGHEASLSRRWRSEHISLEMLKIRVAEQAAARLSRRSTVDRGGQLGLLLQVALRVLLQLLLALLLLQQVFQQQRLILQR
jgi:hypothetical protein